MSHHDSSTGKVAVLTSREAGRYCSVSFRTVIRWVERGELQAYRLPGRGDYRISLVELQAFMQMHGMPGPSTQESSSHRVLIVDDDPPMAAAIQRVLKRAGYDTLIAADGFQAGSLVHTLAPALMTLDLRMPGLDGFGVLQFLREGRLFPSLKVLVISGDTQERLSEALAKGAHEAIAKPFTNEQLRATVQRLLQAPRTR